MYRVDKGLTALGEEVIKAQFPKLTEVAIAFLKSDKPKKNGAKVVYADCEKLSEKMTTITGIDFVITFYKDSEDLTMVAQRILMEHELRHVGWDGEKARIVPHDVDDFRAIIEKYGIDWEAYRQQSMFEEMEA